MSKYAPHHRGSNSARATSSTICQKCLGNGHFTYQCKKPRPYVSRPSRTEQLENPRALARAQPSVQVPEEFKTKTGTANRILEAREKERLEKGKEPARKKAKHGSHSGASSSDSDSGSDSSSGSESDSSSGSNSDSSSGSSSRRRRKPRRSASP